MARTLTSPATTEKDKATGATPVRILEVQFGGGTGTKYYAAQALSSPVTAEGRVIDWGQLRLQADPEKVGGHGQTSIELADTDHALKALFETEPGIQNKPCYVHLWFDGTTWPDDRITVFGGIITAPLRWSDGIWNATLNGFETQFDYDVGQAITRQAFPEVVCQDCEGAIIPIAYGAPVHRVPACVIDRPGRAALNATLDVVPDTTLTINQTAGDAGFTTGSTITLIVGVAGRFERITGSFASAGSTTFTIQTRGCILATGTTDGVFSAAGIQYIIIPKATLPDDGATSRGGYPLYLQTTGGDWVATLITHWTISGSSIVVAEKGSLDVVQGAAFKIGSAPGSVPTWQPGTPVAEDGTWKYAANFLPASSVIRVEGRGRYNLPGGDSQQFWATYNPEHYTVALNDQTHNTALGRDPGDDGITTITLSNPPTAFGFDELTVYVTMNGIGAYDNAADIIQHLLTNQELGNVDSSTYVNTTAFTAAKAAITTSMGFALLEKASLNDLCADLAHQAGALFFWDGGKATLAKLVNTLDAGDNQLTITNANHAEGSLSLDDADVRKLTTEAAGKFRMNMRAEEIRLVRESGEAIGYWGRRRRELNLWAYQYPTSVAAIVEFWLTYFLHAQRTVTFETHLVGLHLQPGDTITLDIDAGDATAIFDSVLARVVSITHTAGSAEGNRAESLRVTCEIRLFDLVIDTGTVTDLDCNAPINAPGYQVVYNDGDMVGIGDHLIPWNDRGEPVTSYQSSETPPESSTPPSSGGGSSSTPPGSSSGGGGGSSSGGGGGSSGGGGGSSSGGGGGSSSGASSVGSSGEDCVAKKPNSNVNTVWFDYDYAKLADDDTGTYADAGPGDDNETQKWGVEQISEAFGQVDRITVRVYGNRGQSEIPQPTINLSVGGVTQTSQDMTMSSGFTVTWTEYAFEGPFTNEDARDVEVWITTGEMGKNQHLFLRTMRIDFCANVSDPCGESQDSCLGHTLLAWDNFHGSAGNTPLENHTMDLGNGWTQVAGEFEVQSYGVAGWGAIRRGTPLSLYTTDLGDVCDYRVTADVSVKDPEIDSPVAKYARVHVRHSSANDYIAAVVSLTDTNPDRYVYELWKVEGGSITALDTAVVHLSVPDDNRFSIEIEAVGHNIRAQFWASDSEGGPTVLEGVTDFNRSVGVAAIAAEGGALSATADTRFWSFYASGCVSPSSSSGSPIATSGDLLVHDTFTDSDGVDLEDHTSDTGHTWEYTAGDGAAEIESNELAYRSNDSALHFVEASESDVRILCDVTPGNAATELFSLVGRYLGSGDYWRGRWQVNQALKILEHAEGSTNERASTPFVGTPGEDYHVEFNLQGSQLTLSIGATNCYYISGSHRFGTKHGLAATRSISTLDTLVDDFKIVRAGASSGV